LKDGNGEEETLDLASGVFLSPTEKGEGSSMPVVHLRRGEGQRLLAGHPWVYQTEVEEIRGDIVPGAIVDVVDHRGKFLGRGYLNPASQILVRLLTTKEEPIDRTFFRRRLEDAWEYRRRFLPDVQAYRLVFGEADFLPGLIVDRFGDYLVLQTLALGIDRWKDEIVDLLREMLHPVGIYERNDAPVRELEGLPLRKGFLGPPFPTPIQIEENGLKILVDVEKGQKTGYFLDQRENRAAIRPYARGKRVLDCFCHTGGFSLNAAAAGARSVVAVDSSAEALAGVRENARLNHLEEKITTVEANAFDFLRTAQSQGEKYDLIILDPPAFAKNRNALEGAIRGYKEINLRAMKILPPGGILVTCSCSHHLSRELFWAVLKEASRDTRRRLRLLEERTQGRDHPVLFGYDESYYLKCFIVEVL